MKNLPNTLTVIRIIFAPIVFIGLYSSGEWVVIGLVFFILGSLTDWLDGYFARRHKLVSGFGQFADPVADKLLSGFALAGIAASGYAAAWPVVGIIVRDVMVTSFRFWGLSKGYKILPSKPAQLKTFLEFFSIIGLIGYIVLGGKKEGFWLGTAILAVVFALALFTGIDYFWKNRKLLSMTAPVVDNRPDRPL